MIDFEISEIQRQMIDMVKKFGTEKVAPAEIELDHMADSAAIFESDEYWDVMSEAFVLGFHKMAIAEDFGGLGLNPLTNGMVWEQMGYHGAGFAASLMSCAVAPRLITFLAPGNTELVEKFVTPFCQDTTAKKISAWGSSEPDVGSDGKNYYDLDVRHRTTAKKKGDHYIINGTKSNFISNGSVADLFIVFACEDPALGIRGSGAFLVPAGTKGVSWGKPTDKLGLRTLNQAPVFFEDVEIPEQYRLFPPGEGYPMLHESIITVGSLGVGYLALGLMRAAFETARDYAKERVQWGSPIIEHQLITKKLYEAHEAIETARGLLWKASWLCEKQFPGDLKCSLTARIYTTNQAFTHTSEMVQILGGYGISSEYPVEKYMRDAKLLQIMDGTNETLMLKLGGLL